MADRRIQHAFSKEIVAPPELENLTEWTEAYREQPQPVAEVKVRSEAYDELSRRAVNEKPPHLPNGVVGQLFGISVVIDDTIPEDPGFEVVYRDGLTPTEGESS